jgi:uncharacterized membrane protein
VEGSPAPGRTAAVALIPPASELSAAPLSERPAILLATATIAVQICDPLLTGGALRVATVTAVVLFASASLTHAAATRGPAAAARLLLVAGGIGLAAEAVGVATGVPFGEYRYDGSLGPQLLGVPLLVPLAWTMMAYPCLLLGRRLARAVARRRIAVPRHGTAVALGAATLTGWDLFLDPQMVADGRWTWAHPAPGVPGVPTVPLTNYAGWLLVATVLMAALDRALPPDGDGLPGAEVAPALLLGWTWIGSTVGNLAFFDRPAVACYGAVAMGVTVLPYLTLLAAGRPTARPGCP